VTLTSFVRRSFLAIVSAIVSAIVPDDLF